MDILLILKDSLKTTLMIYPIILAVIVPLMAWLMWSMRKQQDHLKVEVKEMFANRESHVSLAEVELQALQHLMAKLHSWNLSVSILSEVYPSASVRKIGK